MGDEEVMTMSDYDGNGDDDERVSEWELGLPSADDLTPLSQNLIPANLAAPFSITPEPRRTAADVMRASRKTISTLRGSHSHSREYYSTKNDKSFDEKNDGGGGDEAAVVEEADSALRIENNCSSGGRGVSAAAAAKRARLVWTPQLHKRFVEVVAHLGIKNAVPKTIMQLMNVEGLTRENVASHLQKYRLYLKRMHGGASDEDCPNPSSSDALFASTPVPPPQSLTQHELGYAGGYENGNRHMSISVPMQYSPPGAFMAMPPSYMGMASGGGGYHGGFELHRSYNNMMQHQQTYGGMVSYPPHVVPNEK